MKPKTRSAAALTQAKGRKVRTTVSISHDAASFVESYRKRHNHESTSAAIEELIRKEKNREWREKLDAEMSAYYDSLTDEEVAEQKAWAEFAGRALFESGDNK